MRTPQADVMMAPVVGGARAPQRVTGTTSTANATVLPVGVYVTLVVSPTSTNVSLRWGSTAPTAVANDVTFGPGARFDWTVTDDTKFVAGFPKDGTSTFEFFVWESSH